VGERVRNYFELYQNGFFLFRKGAYVMKWVLVVSAALFSMIYVQCSDLNDSRLKYKRDALLEYARMHAGTESTRQWEDEYWDVIGDFDCIDDYYEIMKLMREVSFLYALDDDFWCWEDESFELEYRQRREELR
jgi:hypothetical protein